MDTVQITWEVSDGYISGSRPQRTDIDVRDIDVYLSREDVKELIECWVQTDFEESVYPSISEKNMERAVDQIMEILAQHKAEEEEFE